jgi:hypothetical protein
MAVYAEVKTKYLPGTLLVNHNYFRTDIVMQEFHITVKECQAFPYLKKHIQANYNEAQLLTG